MLFPFFQFACHIQPLLPKCKQPEFPRLPFQAAAKLAPADANPHWRLARLYQSMGKKQEAAVEFQKTSNLHKAEQESIAAKLKAAQEKGKPADYSGALPADK